MRILFGTLGECNLERNYYVRDKEQIGIGLRKAALKMQEDLTVVYIPCKSKNPMNFAGL
jgi:hypothetical protein